MKWFNKIKNALTPAEERYRDFVQGKDLDAVSTSAGMNISEENSVYVSGVFACVRVLAEDLASLPFGLYRNLLKGKEKAIDHQLFYLLHDSPNPEMTALSFKEALMTNLLLWGNAYAQIMRDRNGRVQALYPLLSSRMVVMKDTETYELVYKYTNLNGITTQLTKEQIFHIPGIGFDGLVGLSPISVAREAVGLAKATEMYGSKFFSNGARPGGILEHPGVVKDPAKVRESWEQVYKGVNNSHKIAVLEEGMHYHEIGIPPGDAQFLETRKFQLNEICRLFRIPPHMVGDLERATFSNIEHQSIEYVVHTLRPWLVRWEQAVNMHLLMPYEQGIYFSKFNVDGLLRGDFKTRMDGYAVGIQNGFLSPNDVRELEDLNSIEYGDIYAMNGNMLKLQDIGAFIKQKQSNNKGSESSDANL